jgi:hypothetical protein
MRSRRKNWAWRRSCEPWSPVHDRHPYHFPRPPLLHRYNRRRRSHFFSICLPPGAPSIPSCGRTQRPRRKVTLQRATTSGGPAYVENHRLNAPTALTRNFLRWMKTLSRLTCAGRMPSEPMPSVRTTRAFFSRRISMVTDGRTTHRRIRGPARTQESMWPSNVHARAQVVSRGFSFRSQSLLFSRADWAPSSSPGQRRRSPRCHYTHMIAFSRTKILCVGGFGNLIALPLAKAPRERGNTVFLSADLKPVPDQWEFLRTVHRLSAMNSTRFLRASHLFRRLPAPQNQPIHRSLFKATSAFSIFRVPKYQPE